MIVIYAEKYSVGATIAAALGPFYLPDGTAITMKNLKKYEKKVETFQKTQGFLDITFDAQPCKVTWGYGHLYCLKDAADYNKDYKMWNKRPKCFIPDRFELKATDTNLANFNKTLNKQRKIIKELFSKADLIINATDDDREGELIFAYVYEALKCCKPFKRVHFTSQTEKGIQESFRHLLSPAEIHNLELAGRARSIYDWIIGTNLTARVTLKNPGNGVLSYGRVQTVVQRMVVDRELAIRNFKSTPFWTIKAEFTTDKEEQYSGDHKQKRFDKKEDAEKIVREITGEKGIVTDIKSKKETKSVPLLYSQSSLQIDANSIFGYTAKETLDTAQWLYANGYTTYPRTKSQYLTDDMEPVVINILNKLETHPEYSKYLAGKIKKPAKKFFNSEKVISHFAIIPTENIPTTLTKQQADIYGLIAKSLIRTIYPDAIIESTTVTTTVKKQEFISTGNVIVSKGWLEVDGKKKEKTLPKLSKKEVVDGRYELKEGKTEPPKRYDDGSLVRAMVTCGKDVEDEELRKILASPDVEGIGTDATRDSIIETLIKREYMIRKGKCFYATEKGIKAIEAFPIKELQSPEFTAKMEKRLSNIEYGKEDYDTFMKDVNEQVNKWCDEIEKSHMSVGSEPTARSSDDPSALHCPMCGGNMRKLEWGWGCSNYRSGCRFYVGKEIKEKKITDSNVKLLLTKGETKLITGFIGRKGAFDAKLALKLAQTDREGNTEYSDYTLGTAIPKNAKVVIGFSFPKV